MNDIKKTFDNYPFFSFAEERNLSQTILETTKNWSADLLILRTHGKNGLLESLMGSVTKDIHPTFVFGSF